MITKENIKKIIIDVEGSSYVKFETDLNLKNESLGDFYWQGDGKFFEINMSDLLNNRTDDELNLDDFLSDDAQNYLMHLANYELQDFI